MVGGMSVGLRCGNSQIQEKVTVCQVKIERVE